MIEGRAESSALPMRSGNRMSGTCKQTGAASERQKRAAPGVNARGVCAANGVPKNDTSTEQKPSFNKTLWDRSYHALRHGDVGHLSARHVWPVCIRMVKPGKVAEGQAGPCAPA